MENKKLDQILKNQHDILDFIWYYAVDNTDMKDLATKISERQNETYKLLNDAHETEAKK